jgi:hypothetical protein
MATPDKQRKAAERARMRSRGFVLRQLWVHPNDWDSVRAYVERKRKRHGFNEGSALRLSRPRDE